MANPKKRAPENVPGDFFVDSTCIDCDARRQIAIRHFTRRRDLLQRTRVSFHPHAALCLLEVFGCIA